MKIVLFDENRNVIEEITDVQGAQIIGKNEVRWHNGGMGGIQTNFVIIEDNRDFNDVTEEEILEQYKTQLMYEVATQYERNRVDYLVNGFQETEEKDVKATLTEIANKGSREEITEVVNNRNRIAQERRNMRGRPSTLPTIPSNPSNPGQGNSGRAASQDVKIVFTEE